VPGESASDYLRTSIVDPEAYLAPDCPNGPCLAGIMPGDYAIRLTAGQIDTLVDFLLEQKAASTSASEAGSDQAPSDGISPVVIVLAIILGVAIVVALALIYLKLPGNSDESQES
jgi:hypothetical protein